MALPNIFRKLFKSNGYGPLLKDEIVSKHISVQDWSNAFDYPVATVARGADGILYYSVAQSGPSVAAGPVDPSQDTAHAYWAQIPTLSEIDAAGYATQTWVGSQGYALDSNVVHKTGDETISGEKSFVNVIKRLNIANLGPNFRPDSGESAWIGGVFFYGNSGARLYGYIEHYVDYGISEMHIAAANAQGASTFKVVVRRSFSTGEASFLPDEQALLGDANHRWKQLYATTGTINTSDARLKTSISSIPDEVLDAWGSVGFAQFQFRDAFEGKGDEARFHSGLIAQQIDESFKAHGLDASRYGLFCHDSWEAEPERIGADGMVERPASPAGDQYSLRYEEALCMEAAYQRRRADRAEARIAALEERLAAIEAKLG